MCGRIGLPGLTWAQFLAWQRGHLDWSEIEREGDADFLTASWNIAPTQMVETLRVEDQKLISATARWWFVPHFFRGDVADWKSTTFNARIETAAEKPTFRQAWKSNRCVIPAIGYYEWTGDKGAKQPWWITTDRNEPFFFFAGLFSKHPGLNTTTIVTRAADPQIEHIHARTPVILSHDEIEPWLMGSDDHIAELGTRNRFKFHEVNKIKRGDDGPQLIDPLDQPGRF